MKKINISQNKRGLALLLGGGVLLLVLAAAACILLLRGPASEPAVAVSSEPASSEPEASAPSSSTISIPPIPLPDPSEPASSEAPASSTPDLTVEAPSPAPAASKPAASSAPAKPVELPATDTSASVPEAPPASRPENTQPDPLPPESNDAADGYRHGDTWVDGGETYYYHAGAGGFIDYPFWCMWGPYPQTKMITTAGGYKRFDGSFLAEGAESGDWETSDPVHWCTQEQAWISHFSWTNGYHDQIHPGWKK